MRFANISLKAASQVLKHDGVTHDDPQYYGFALNAPHLSRFDFAGLQAGTKVELQAWRPGLHWAKIASFENTDGGELSIEQTLWPGPLCTDDR